MFLVRKLAMCLEGPRQPQRTKLPNYPSFKWQRRCWCVLEKTTNVPFVATPWLWVSWYKRCRASTRTIPIASNLGWQDTQTLHPLMLHAQTKWKLIWDCLLYHLTTVLFCNFTSNNASVINLEQHHLSHTLVKLWRWTVFPCILFMFFSCWRRGDKPIRAGKCRGNSCSVVGCRKSTTRVQFVALSCGRMMKTTSARNKMIVKYRSHNLRSRLEFIILCSRKPGPLNILANKIKAYLSSLGLSSQRHCRDLSHSRNSETISPDLSSKLLQVRTSYFDAPALQRSIY